MTGSELVIDGGTTIEYTEFIHIRIFTANWTIGTAFGSDGLGAESDKSFNKAATDKIELINHYCWFQKKS